MENNEPRFIINLGKLKLFMYSQVEALTAHRIMAEKLANLATALANDCEANLRLLQELEAGSTMPENPNEPTA